MTAGLLDKYDRARRKQQKGEEKVTEKRKRVMYLRDEEGNPTGVMVAMETDSETLRFGMVRYHPVKEHLPFTKKKAKEIAFDRAAKCSFRLPLGGEGYSYEWVHSKSLLESAFFQRSRVHTIPENLGRHVKFFIAQALERLGISKFENVFDPNGFVTETE